jgi:Tfp pilus assembly protein PilO
MKANYKKYVSTMSLVWMGSFIVFLFAYMLLLSPQNKTKHRQQAQLDKVREQYDLALLASNPEHKADQLKQIESLKNQVGDYVIYFENSSNLTFDISQLAGQLRISALSSKTKTEQPVEKCNHISENQIYISFNGTFSQFLNLLNLLERHRPVVFVDNFSVERSELSNEFSMELAVFVMKQPVIAKGKI